MSKRDVTLKDLICTISEDVYSESIRENTCGNYASTKEHVRDLLNDYGMTYVTDNQVTILVNRDWRCL